MTRVWDVQVICSKLDGSIHSVELASNQQIGALEGILSGSKPIQSSSMGAFSKRVREIEQKILTREQKLRELAQKPPQYPDLQDLGYFRFVTEGRPLNPEEIISSITKEDHLFVTVIKQSVFIEALDLLRQAQEVIESRREPSTNDIVYIEMLHMLLEQLSEDRPASFRQQLGVNREMVIRFQYQRGDIAIHVNFSGLKNELKSIQFLWDDPFGNYMVAIFFPEQTIDYKAPAIYSTPKTLFQWRYDDGITGADQPGSSTDALHTVPTAGDPAGNMVATTSDGSRIPAQGRQMYYLPGLPSGKRLDPELLASRKTRNLALSRELLEEICSV